jgi:hypothetical protein
MKSTRQRALSFTIAHLVGKIGRCSQHFPERHRRALDDLAGVGE